MGVCSDFRRQCEQRDGLWPLLLQREQCPVECELEHRGLQSL
nr:MAG TPA: hypothetical protein [Caudoviricetes sp.]